MLDDQRMITGSTGIAGSTHDDDDQHEIMVINA